MRRADVTARKPSWQRWGTPAVAVALGVAYFVAGWLGGDRAFAVSGFILMTAIGAGFLVLRSMSETVSRLLDRTDERINRIDADATVFAGMAVITAVIVGFIVEVARGNDAWPYSMLGAIGGIAYVAALVFYRWRR